MPTTPIYQVDAFTRDLFHGNPAAVCPLREWLPDDIMQRIAMENNLADTAFIVPDGDDFQIRWFTPTVEVDLCGHATLASAAVYFVELGYGRNDIRFNSRSGRLTVSREADGQFTLDFPGDPPSPVQDPPSCIFEGLGISPAPVWKGKFDYLVELADEAAVLSLRPDFRRLSDAPSRGVLVTAPGTESDFVSRAFFPQSGIDEDPVTGSAHCMLVPYWAKKMGRNALSAIQVSARRGWLGCRLEGDRVRMSGRAALYLKGEIRF
jgi:PhzF family phenazine biosynthesis protein